MKNRFYYSFSQACITSRLMGIGDVGDMEGIRENYVWTPNGWEQYTEWCSTKGTKCNWDDARLVFETNKEPKIKIEYRKTSALVAKELTIGKLKKELARVKEELSIYKIKDTVGLADFINRNSKKLAIKELENAKIEFETYYADCLNNYPEYLEDKINKLKGEIK